MTRLILAILALALVGCGHNTLREDPVIPAVKANYPTLEFEACGSLWHGVGICYLEAGKNPTSVRFKVQGYYKGTIRIFSAACNLDKTLTYANNELFDVPIPELEPNRNCLITAVMSPEYPKEARQEVAVYSLKGLLAIRIQSGEEVWTGAARKLSGQWRSQIDLEIGAYSQARLAIRGCGVAYDQNRPIEQGRLHFELSEAVLRVSRGECIADGVALIPRVVDHTLTVLVAQYATSLPGDPEWGDYGFSPLAIPVVSLDGSSLKVEATDYVSILSLNGEYEMDYKASFKFDRTKRNILRAITVKGRSVLGVWNPEKQEWTWMQ